MCTLIAALRSFENYPLIIAANRDERMDRRSSPIKVWAGAHPFLAPRDDESGGTWVGVNPFGLFVGITNRFGASRNPALKSRGLIVTEALKCPTASGLHEVMLKFDFEQFNPFHLLYADAKDAFVSWYDGERFSHQALSSGLHIVTERSLGGDDKARTELIRSRWPFKNPNSVPAVGPLIELLRLQGSNPGEGICLHVPALNYGTRSSLILLIAKTWSRSSLYWADRQPCTSPFEDRNRDLIELESFRPA